MSQRLKNASKPNKVIASKTQCGNANECPEQLIEITEGYDADVQCILQLGKPGPITTLPTPSMRDCCQDQCARSAARLRFHTYN